MEQKNYLPIILVSGVSADHNGMNPMIALIKKHLSPNVYVKHVAIGLGEITSFYDMHIQTEDLANAIQNDGHLSNGFNIVAHSQGGLVARYLIENYSFPVYNYIALGSPQRGINGIPKDTVYTYLHYLEPYISTLLYTWPFKTYVSFAGYWNDSLRHKEYLKYCDFLPYINNEKQHEQFQVFKQHIIKLKNMVLVQSTKEEVVEPPISCHFGFYKEGSTTDLESIFESDIYKNDTLGLQELYNSDRLHLRSADCYHTKFESDEKNFIDNVLPYLQLDKDEKFIEDVKREQPQDIY